MNETEIVKAIIDRLAELKPVVDEYERLKGAELVLGQIPKAITAEDITRSGNKARGHGPKLPDPTKGRRYSKGEKKAAKSHAGKHGVKLASRAYGIPEATIYRWLRGD